MVSPRFFMPALVAMAWSIPAAACPLARPVPGPITQGWSTRHPAIDFACKEGEIVRAAHDGTMSVSRSSTLGITATLHDRYGRTTTYSHLQAADAPGVFLAGDPIGLCGNTGSWSTGPHLHFTTNEVTDLAVCGLKP